ncbi:MAG: cobalamin biosynthesis protein, partial [Rhodoferax sp.]|uniref:cobalamin biosynthesis protein n=1 Tax=Rhodoferax sp. TaxID=50421 RepID=UPI003263EE71
RVWEWAGKWAAWADDVLSWLPARITAVLLMVLAYRSEWRALGQQARLTPSPNSGWPMAAMALCLGVRLGKPGVYTLNAAGRVPASKDTPKAVFYARNTVLAQVLLAVAAMVLVEKWL